MTTAFEALFNKYLSAPQNRDEKHPGVEELLEQGKSAADWTSRRQFPSHFTASCLLVDAVKRRILLFWHPIHGRVLQPGGHFEGPDEKPTEVAIRKLLQETTYTTDLIRYLPCNFDLLVPIDIDTHTIRATEKEPEHCHHDLRFVYLAVAGEGENRTFTAKLPKNGTAEDYAYRWHDLAELDKLPTFGRLRKKLHDFLSIDSARRRFFIGLTQRFPIAQTQPRPKTIIVTHVLPDAADFLEALRESTDVIGVIPKPKSKDLPTCELLKSQGLPVIEVERENIVNVVNELLGKENARSAVLLDIGGWFVPLIDNLGSTALAAIRGIVEDTKNGEKKYREYAKNHSLPFPVVSVAESGLKANEDYLVGKSIVFSADAVLRECGLVLDHLECSVIGYGKIGRSIAHHLMQRRIKPFVVDIDALRSVAAVREGCAVRDRDWANRNADVIFCATGSQATGIKEFRSLRSGAFIFSVTSSDDEFDTVDLKKQYNAKPHPLSDRVTMYDGEENHFYLVNNGNAVNFLHDAVLWEFIQLVKGGIYGLVQSQVTNPSG